jgi:hypothetical protein
LRESRDGGRGSDRIVGERREGSKKETNPRIGFEKLDLCVGEAVEKLAARTKRLDMVIQCAGKLSRWEEYKIRVFQAVLDHRAAAPRVS